MSERFFDGINWQRPWLAPLLPVAMPIVSSNDWRSALNSAAHASNLRNHRDLPIQFVAQSDLPPGVAYEAFIGTTGCIPTRDNVHDLFNALVWLTFPRIKSKLNALQAIAIEQAIVRTGASGTALQKRGKLRDAATIFDENAALLVTRNMDLVDHLRAHHWRDVFLDGRADFERDCEVWLFGHALMEKLVVPYKAITAHAWIVRTDEKFFSLSSQKKRESIDATVERQLVHGLANADFAPLPVLGVPAWWSAQSTEFYADTKVFRPKRT